MAASAMLHRLNQQAPLLAGAVILVLFGIYLAAQISDWQRLVQTPAEAVSDPAPVVGVAPDLQQMEQLFGTPPMAPAQAQVSSLASTDFTLLGSFVHAQPERSIAIIRRAGGLPELFRPGAELDSGISLQTVYADRVEISRNGSLETLYFPASRSAPLLPEDYPDYSEPTDAQTEEPQDPDTALLQQQMEALRQQLEASGATADETPSQ